jgi:TrpR family trp operon transcriptional repressor
MQAVKELAEIFAGIGDVKTMETFFGEIFTEAERNDFALRWQLMKMLREKVSQREIAGRLGISLCKITRGAKIIHNPESVTSIILNSK